MSQDDKLDEALRGTFPASDAFYLYPEKTASSANDEARAHAAPRPGADALHTIEGRSR